MLAQHIKKKNMKSSVVCLILTLVALTSCTQQIDSTNIVKRAAEPTLTLLLQKKLAKKALLFGKHSVADKEEDHTIAKRDAEPTLTLLLQKKLAKKAALFG